MHGGAADHPCSAAVLQSFCVRRFTLKRQVRRAPLVLLELPSLRDVEQFLLRCAVQPLRFVGKRRQFHCCHSRKGRPRTPAQVQHRDARERLRRRLRPRLGGRAHELEIPAAVPAAREGLGRRGGGGRRRRPGVCQPEEGARPDRLRPTAPRAAAGTATSRRRGSGRGGRAPKSESRTPTFRTKKSYLATNCARVWRTTSR